MPSDEQIAWCAGFFEGEGSIHCRRRSVTLQVSQVDREPLDRFAEALGGRVLGPYGPYDPTRQAYYSWQAQGVAAIRVFSLLAPLLSKRRHDAWWRAVETKEARRAA